jgi:hypothetical protein
VGISCEGCVPHFIENRYIAPFSLNRLSGLFHNKIHLLWNRPESLFIKEKDY